MPPDLTSELVTWTFDPLFVADLKVKCRRLQEIWRNSSGRWLPWMEWGRSVDAADDDADGCYVLLNIKCCWILSGVEY